MPGTPLGHIPPKPVQDTTAPSSCKENTLTTLLEQFASLHPN